jgi:hypothetical protein
MRDILVEADWEVEIGPGAPVIDVHWSGFVDLRQTPEFARQLPEVAWLRGLDDALVCLNGAQSPVWTAKCDVWPLNTGEFDTDEMEASFESAAFGQGCYIDLLPRNDQQWSVPATAISWCKDICGLLRAIPLSCCRVDLIIRSAALSPDQMNIGITVYLTSCGPSAEDANQVLQAAISRFVDALCGRSTIE